MDDSGNVTERFSPPLVVHAGEDIQFSCTWNNVETFTLVHGASNTTEEMCVFSALYYPLPAGTARTRLCR